MPSIPEPIPEPMLIKDDSSSITPTVMSTIITTTITTAHHPPYAPYARYAQRWGGKMGQLYWDSQGVSLVSDQNPTTKLNLDLIFVEINYES